MKFEHLWQIIENECNSLGIKEYELYYENVSDTSVELLKNEISSFSSSLTGGVCLRLLNEGKMGYASSELITDEELRELPLRAIENAKNTEKLDTVGIFHGSKTYNTPENEASDSSLSTEKIKEIATEMQRALYASSDKITDGTQSGASSVEREVRIANSHGLRLSRKVCAGVIMAEAVVRVGDESEADYTVKNFKDGMCLENIASEVSSSALSKIGAGTVASGKYATVISGKQMRTLLSVYSQVFSARNVQMGMSLLRGRLGEKIAADCITITDDPSRNSSSIHFDAEGVATYRKAVVENGVLKTFLHNRESALRDGVETTGNASKASYSSPVGISPYVFCIEAGNYTLDELFKKAENGVYITEMKGLHAGANAITGDFSIECAGFRIENGKLSSAIKSFTIAGNFFELIKNVDSLSSNLEIGVTGGGFTTFGAPDALIFNAGIAGK